MDQLKELNNRKYLLTLIKSSGKYFFEWSDSSEKMQTVAVSGVSPVSRGGRRERVGWCSPAVSHCEIMGPGSTLSSCQH